MNRHRSKEDSNPAKIFIRSVLMIFIFTALLKLQASYGTAKVLNEEEPLFGISYRAMIFLTAIAEFVCVYVLWSTDVTAISKLRLIQLAGAAFLLYHAAVWSMGVGDFCPCLGTLFQRVPISQRALVAISVFFAAYMFIGSIFFSKRGRSQIASSSPVTTIDATLE